MIVVNPLTADQMAALLGISVRRVEQLKRDDPPLPTTVEGHIPCEAAGVWLRDRLIRQLGASEQHGDFHDYDYEKARIAHHKANIMAIEEDIKRGIVVPVEVLQMHWESMIGNARAKLLSLPGKLAARVTSTGDVLLAEAEARKLIYEALTELSEHGTPTPA